MAITIEPASGTNPTPLRVTAESTAGGAVKFNEQHGAWASYAVAGIAGREPPQILYAGATLLDGRHVQFFLNRTSGLIVVDIADADERGGIEIIRRYA